MSDTTQGAPESGTGSVSSNQATAGKGDAAQQTPEQGQNAAQREETEVDWKAAARKWERQARENATAAEELAKPKESEKTDLQKALDRAAKAEQRLAETERNALRLSVAAKHGISGEYLDLLHGSDEESLNTNAERIAKLINGKAGRVPNTGRTPQDKPRNSASVDERELASRLFNS